MAQSNQTVNESDVVLVLLDEEFHVKHLDEDFLMHPCCVVFVSSHINLCFDDFFSDFARLAPDGEDFQITLAWPLDAINMFRTV